MNMKDKRREKLARHIYKRTQSYVGRSIELKQSLSFDTSLTFGWNKQNKREEKGN